MKQRSSVDDIANAGNRGKTLSVVQITSTISILEQRRQMVERGILPQILNELERASYMGKCDSVGFEGAGVTISLTVATS